MGKILYTHSTSHLEASIICIYTIPPQQKMQRYNNNKKVKKYLPNNTRISKKCHI